MQFNGTQNLATYVVYALQQVLLKTKRHYDILSIDAWIGKPHADVFMHVNDG